MIQWGDKIVLGYGVGGYLLFEEFCLVCVFVVALSEVFLERN